MAGLGIFSFVNVLRKFERKQATMSQWPKKIWAEWDDRLLLAAPKQVNKCPCLSVPRCHRPVLLITPKCITVASCLSFRLTSSCPPDTSTWVWHTGTSNSCRKLDMLFSRAALPPVFSVTGPTKLDTWESSFLLPSLLHPYSQSVPKDGCSLQTLTGSTLSPLLLTLPRFSHRSSPAPQQSLPGVWLPAFSSSDPSSTQHWGKGSV